MGRYRSSQNWVCRAACIGIQAEVPELVYLQTLIHALQLNDYAIACEANRTCPDQFYASTD